MRYCDLLNALNDLVEADPDVLDQPVTVFVSNDEKYVAVQGAIQTKKDHPGVVGDGPLVLVASD